MEWREITVSTDSLNSELVAYSFESIGCTGGVKIIDKNDILDIIRHHEMWDYIDENILEAADDIVKVSGYVSLDEYSEKLEALKARLDEYGVKYGEINTAVVDDESWYESWKKYYSPIYLGKYVIVPKWINNADIGNHIEIKIDPGMAFGTGEHESTKLCLGLLSEIDVLGKDVIDVGTGSGILGIAAAKSGAKSVYMCDIDSIAVTAARQNSELNGASAQVIIENADLLTKTDKIGDIILANLTADILIRLSNGLTAHLRNNGYLICSGIIHVRKNEVIEAMKKAGLTLLKMKTMGEWDALLFAK